MDRFLTDAPWALVEPLAAEGPEDSTMVRAVTAFEEKIGRPPGPAPDPDDPAAATPR